MEAERPTWHAHFQRKSGPSGLLVVVVVVLLLLLLDLASANRTGAEARRGAEARKCGGAEGKAMEGHGGAWRGGAEARMCGGTEVRRRTGALN